MRVPNEVQFQQPWRVHAVLADFPLEDLWQYPGITGTRDEFADVLELVSHGNPGQDGAWPVRLLWNVRDALGRWFGLGEITRPADGPLSDSLLHRVPDDLRGTADDVRFEALPFVPLFRTDTEFAAEIANRTMHGVMHLGWVERDDGRYFAQMAVYVRPNGRFGRAYMGFIKPFRYLVVYPAQERQLTREWTMREVA